MRHPPNNAFEKNNTRKIYIFCLKQKKKKTWLFKDHSPAFTVSSMEDKTF